MTRLSRIHYLLLLCIGIAAWAPALPTGFLYDDHLLIESNPGLYAWSGENLKRDFTSGVFSAGPNKVPFYRPLQTLTTRLEFTLVQRHPLLYHVTNLALHLGNTLLLYELLLALGFTGLTALLASCLFVAHPIIVEPMLMVSGRGEQLGLFFTLGSLLAYLRQTAGRRFISLAAYLLALLSKESAIVAPGLLLDALYLKKVRAWPVRFIAAMAGVTALYLALRYQAVGSVWPAVSTLHPGKFYLMAFPSALFHYARILLFPVDLHTDRLLPPLGPFWGLATAALIAGGAWLMSRGPRWSVFCFVWYVLNLFPKSVMMMTGSFMSDHWAYPALPALTLPVALALSRHWSDARAARRFFVRGAFMLFLIFEMAVTWQNIAGRNTDEKLYTSALRYTSSLTMHYNLARVLLNQGRPAEARPHLEAILQEHPSDANASRALAWSYWQEKESGRAIAILEDAQRHAPEDRATEELLRQLKPRR
jgi:tetratricopeptide (TPR) repeat protein